MFGSWALFYKRGENSAKCNFSVFYWAIQRGDSRVCMGTQTRCMRWKWCPLSQLNFNKRKEITAFFYFTTFRNANLGGGAGNATRAPHSGDLLMWKVTEVEDGWSEALALQPGARTSQRPGERLWDSCGCAGSRFQLWWPQADSTSW